MRAQLCVHLYDGDGGGGETYKNIADSQVCDYTLKKLDILNPDIFAKIM